MMQRGLKRSRVRDRVAEDQAALGVRVEDLDGLARHGS